MLRTPLNEVVSKRNVVAMMKASLRELSMRNEIQSSTPSLRNAIDHSSAAPPVPIPADHVGPFVIPGTGRLV